MKSPVKSLLEKCGTRLELLGDAQAVDPQLELVAVHRWHQRGSVPSKYWLALIAGAVKRGVTVSAEEFAAAHTKAAESAV